MYNRDKEYWEAVTLAAIASGRANAVVAGRMADELIQLRKERWPEERPDVTVHGQAKPE